jgi:tetratricopeptide (TPR) repeat protein
MYVARSAFALVAALVIAAGGVRAQEVDPQWLGLALAAERQGQLPTALDYYRRILALEPGDAAALTGVERVFVRMGQRDSVGPYVVRAIQVKPRNPVLWEFAFRSAASQGRDSVEAVIRGWTAAIPGAPRPYQMWSFWLAQHGFTEDARQVLIEGQSWVGEVALAPDLARFLMGTGEWVEAAVQWRIVVEDNGGLVAAGATGLGQAPVGTHDQIVERLLEGDPSRPTQWLAADLLARWGRPAEAWTVLDAALPDDQSIAVALLLRFADQATRMVGPGGWRARGYALERLAELSAGSAAERVRLEAAQAFTQAGDLAAARRQLDRLAGTLESPNEDAAAAMAGFIRLLSDAGSVDEAEERFEEWLPRLGGGDAAELREHLAWARVMRGELERAEALLGDATSVRADAVAGWVALYRGDLSQARLRFRAAGPYADSRREATERAAMLVLLERIDAEQLPELGAGLLEALRGDTARALGELERAAERLAPDGGRSEVLMLAADVAEGIADHRRAEALLLGALAADSVGPAAPAAQLRLAQVFSATGRRSEAADRLERLILEHPESAVVPQARRLLDQVRGAIPQS